MEFYFILVEPAVPENVGASARAMKTMGFQHLRLVNPCDYLNIKSRMLAHASTDILEKAQVFSSLSEALYDSELTIGSTAKFRSAQYDYYSCEKIPDLILKKQNSVERVAIVFGREESGLTNEEIRMCDIVTNIPMNTGYPSLNLSQAVMIYAYIMSGIFLSRPDGTPPLKDTDSFEELKQKIEGILSRTEIKNRPVLYHRVIERLAMLGDDDINLLHSLANEISKQLGE